MEINLWMLAVNGHILSQDLKKLLVELDYGFKVGRGHLPWFILKVQNFALQKGPFLAQLHNLETLLALGDDIQSSVLILLADVENHRGAADLGQGILVGPHHSERSFLLQAFTDHLFVTWLKNMQR